LSPPEKKKNGSHFDATAVTVVLLRSRCTKLRRIASKLERVMGIEPTLSAWEAEVLPLNYTRLTGRSLCPGSAAWQRIVRKQKQRAP